ncbi:MAG: methionyl-tRNA formyltransferase [Bacteroidales bacterium]
MKTNLRIVFMGTPEFAVESLDILIRNGYSVAGVVTAPDRPSGRGKKIRYSPVKNYALEKGITVLQPEKLNDTGFLRALRSMSPNLQVVVAFRMLPKAVWDMPEYGTFNLHASLLPDYRGAAPMNWVLINGESKTGVTTFFLNGNIDTGNIIMSKEVSLGSDETYGELHDRLMVIGAELVLETVKALERDEVQVTGQETLARGRQLHTAPKIYKEDCRIDFYRNAKQVHDLVRGLNPLPGAFCGLRSPCGDTTLLKIFRTSYSLHDHIAEPGSIHTDKHSFLKVFARSGYVLVKELQIAGKRRMKTADFLRGFPLDDSWKMTSKV